MANHNQIRYRDSPSSSRSASPALLSPVSIKTPTSPVRPYRDEPEETAHPTSPASPVLRAIQAPAYRPGQTHHSFPMYTDDDLATHDDDDDVPLAYLYPYPTEAPPSYNVAVRQSYRETLITHIPPGSGILEIDDEQGVEHPHPDDVRFFVERVVAASVVTILLMLISGLMFWLAVGYMFPK